MAGSMHERDGAVPASGTVVGGRFEILSRLGAGGMAEVFSVRDRTSGRELALKVLRAEVAAHPEAVERLRREGVVLGSIAHPAIVSIETSGILEDGRVFLAMERLEGETLRDRMRRGPMPVAELSTILTHVASGLAAAHQSGVLHRDLKPDNLFLRADGTADAPQVKILDFGVSKVLGDSRLTRSGQIIGTPRYMAPEQLRADRDLDARIDVYALGVIAYEALAGQPPFPTHDPAELIVAIVQGRRVPLRSLRVDLPPGIEAVVERAMQPDRSGRQGSVTELAQDLAALARGEAPPVRGGMKTDALGSMDPPPAPAVAPPAPNPATYGALSALADEETPARPDVAVASEAAPVPAPVVEPAPDPADADSIHLPTAPRWPWALAAALAGVLTALAALWATGGLGLFGSAPTPVDVLYAASSELRAEESRAKPSSTGAPG